VSKKGGTDGGGCMERKKPKSGGGLAPDFDSRPVMAMGYRASTTFEYTCCVKPCHVE